MSEPAEVKIETRADRKRTPSAEQTAEQGGNRKKVQLALAVLGVVYGDLGTSAIYALHAVFTGESSLLAPSTVNVLGILSLVFWTLIVSVSLKYMTFVLQHDNRGEGGIFALIGLLRPWSHLERRTRRWLVLLGLAGSAMMCAGFLITPAISILSAVEGLEVASAAFKPWVMPTTIVIMVLLFAVQRFGTARVGAAFGPVMVLWFVVIALLGVYGIAQAPQVLLALDPRRIVAFFHANGWTAYFVLFAVFLVTTGAEALYAAIGHFGPKSIRQIWFFFVLPALVLNYFGQGGVLLLNPKAGNQPFYLLIPSLLLLPMVVLATLATIIASQAAITAAFSTMREAARLGMMPPLRVVQTSKETSGQVYLPLVNWVMLAAAIVLVLVFKTSDGLASTYGISVGTTMAVTTILAFFAAHEHTYWPWWAAVLFLLAFFPVDLAYFGSNALRIPHGGWFPVAVGALLFTLMSTWRRGLELLTRWYDEDTRPLPDLILKLNQAEQDQAVARVPGCAVFVTLRRRDTPPSLQHHIERNHALQHQVVLLTVLTEDISRTSGEERATLSDLGDGFFRATLRYGYLQHPNVPSDLAAACKAQEVKIDLADATWYIEHQAPVSTDAHRPGMAAWRDHLFGYLLRNTIDPTTEYQIPVDRIVDVGMRVRI